jgi:hypothetical protein
MRPGRQVLNFSGFQEILLWLKKFEFHPIQAGRCAVGDPAGDVQRQAPTAATRSVRMS